LLLTNDVPELESIHEVDIVPWGQRHDVDIVPWGQEDAIGLSGTFWIEYRMR
jgi:hypothetical protein